MKKAGLSSILVAVVLLVLGVIAEAQQTGKVRRIGYLSSGNPSSESTRSEAIRLALRELGYIEGQNIATEYRYAYAEGKQDRYPELAAELVRLKVDIIVVAGGDGTGPGGQDCDQDDSHRDGGRRGRSCRGRPSRKPCPSRRQRHRHYKPWRTIRREAAGTAHRGRSQTYPCRGSLRAGQSGRMHSR